MVGISTISNDYLSFKNQYTAGVGLGNGAAVRIDDLGLAPVLPDGQGLALGDGDDDGGAVE